MPNRFDVGQRKRVGTERKSLFLNKFAAACFAPRQKKQNKTKHVVQAEAADRLSHDVARWVLGEHKTSGARRQATFCFLESGFSGYRLGEFAVSVTGLRIHLGYEVSGTDARICSRRLVGAGDWCLCALSLYLYIQKY